MKSTTKTIKSPAPATSDSLAPAPAPKNTRVPRVKKTVAAGAASAAAPTVIIAKIDVGFGNTLYLRGDGPGLSWNKGVVLTCADDAAWTISLANAVRPVVFKFLLNDETWSRGEDYTAAPGSTAELTPTF
jgi:hypothetical protein